MKIFHSISDFSSKKPTVVTLGTFDGVHIGHRMILERLMENAAEMGCETLVLTFFPHPRMVLQEDSGIRLLNTLDEKSQLLEQSGLDNLVIHPFDRDFSRLTAEEFVKNVLVDSFNISKIIIGYDHRFGRNRTADINDLITFGDMYGFEVEQISKQQVDQVAVSSTKIRNSLSAGNISLANQYLGYEYLLTGTVVKGRQLGRTLGYPTANIEIPESYKLIPEIGIYIVKSQLDGKTVFGMMSIGFNPTVNGEKQTIEVYYFDFEGDLYDRTISVSILARIRDEEKFESLEALTEQLHRDKDVSLAFIQNYI